MSEALPRLAPVAGTLLSGVLLDALCAACRHPHQVKDHDNVLRRDLVYAITCPECGCTAHDVDYNVPAATNSALSAILGADVRRGHTHVLTSGPLLGHSDAGGESAVVSGPELRGGARDGRVGHRGPGVCRRARDLAGQLVGLQRLRLPGRRRPGDTGPADHGGRADPVRPAGSERVRGVVSE